MNFEREAHGSHQRVRKAWCVISAILLVGCGHAPFGTHSLGTTPLEVPGLNAAIDGYMPRIRNPNYFDGTQKPTPRPRPAPLPDAWCCRATLDCRFSSRTTGREETCEVRGSKCAPERPEAAVDAWATAISACENSIRGKHVPASVSRECWGIRK